MATRQKKGLGLFSIIFFILSGIIGLDGLTASAAVGPSVFGWWALILLFFVVPYVLMVCELGSAFPGEGGVYDWTLHGLGERNAARVGWYYWINVPFWMPSVYLMCAGILSELFFPDMSIWGMIGIALVLVWATVFTVNASLDIGDLVNTLGALAKVLILVALIVGGIIYAGDNGAANELTLESMMPSMDASFMYAPTLLYMLIGVETVACMGSNLRNPQRDLPLGILISVGIVVVLYWASISSMMVALPLEELTLVGGLVQTFSVLFGDSTFGTALTVILSLVAIFGMFAYIIPWVMAASRAAAEAARNNEMPTIFARENKHGAPQGANMATGYVATIALILYGFMAGNADDLFWSLFAFANFLLFITYFFFFGAFIKLRQKQPDAERPFKVPGGNTFALVVAAIPSVILFFGCVLFVFPDAFSGTIDWAYSGPTVAAIVIAMTFIEVSITRLKKAGKQGILAEV